MAQGAIIVLALGYIGMLFAVAWAGERAGLVARLKPWRPLLHALALGVYCTSWTVFGAVGTAVNSGWAYMAIYIGPALVFVFGHRALAHIVRTAKAKNLASISDFIADRYGGSRALAAMATLVAVAGALPYVALQLKALGASVAAFGDVANPTPAHETVLVIAVALAGFAIVFGARGADASKPNPGMVLALAVESVVKMVALLAVGGFAAWLIWSAGVSGAPAEPVAGPLIAWPTPLYPAITMTLLAMAAVVCLPRQFHVLAVESEGPRDVAVARWAFPAYLAAVSLPIVFIAAAGTRLGAGGAGPDLWTLTLPLAHDAPILAVLAFLGGASAATGMVIVAAVALSTMVTNDLVVPALMRAGVVTGRASERDARRVLILVRRGVIVGLLLAAYVFHRLTPGGEGLAAFGLISFVAAAQFIPALLGGFVWRGGRAGGALAGLGVGIAVWAYTLVWPAVAGEAVPTGVWFSPHALFGLTLDPVTHGALWSVGLNALTYVGVSRVAGTRLGRRLLSRDLARTPPRQGLTTRATVGELKALAARFVGEEAAATAFAEHAASRGGVVREAAPADAATARFTQRVLSGALGGSSARVIVASALSDATMTMEDVFALLDAAEQQQQVNRQLLGAALECVSQGVALVDADMRLVAWNQQYLDIFDFPDGFVHVGKPVEGVIRFNALRGECGPGEVDALVAKRVAHMRAGTPHEFERVRPGGMVLRTQGSPTPDGGYVMSFTDITKDKLQERALADANERLEARVAARTRDLEVLAGELREAKRTAERANRGKTTFLAAASHDLLQPLNAARLFTSALGEDLAGAAPERRRLVDNVERSIASADRLLRALLDISKLDQGGVEPNPTAFALRDLLDEIVEEFAPSADERALRLKAADTDVWVRADRTLLRSVIANFVSNGLRYTAEGGVLIGARRRGEAVRIDVWDTGCGVPEDQRQAIFDEFRRLPGADASGDRGVGLGLAIVERIATLLNAPVNVVSREGRGSVFSITVPQAAPPARTAQVRVLTPAPEALAGVHVLCVDNEADVREAMAAALERWGCVVHLASGRAEALAAAAQAGAPFEAALVDYHLDHGANGLDLVDALAPLMRGAKLALVTADRTEAVGNAAAARGVTVLHKPVDPAALRAWLAAAHAQAAE